MRFVTSIFATCLLFITTQLFASDKLLINDRISTIDRLLERAVSDNLITGGVVVIGNRNEVLAVKSKGKLDARPNSPLLDEHTMFDIASLTKVIATAPAVMKLLDERRISLQDPLVRWFPEFKGTGLGNSTILNLLTHTSGLSDFTLSKSRTMKKAIRKAAKDINHPHFNNYFNYADINFIILGELVRRVSGKRLDRYCREKIFAPLGTDKTMFRPPRNAANHIAPTLGYSSGIVQDPNARRLGGVAGHAGLFSSADDLARFARLMLNGGLIDGKRILSERIVSKMTAPNLCSNGKVVRGLGWDIDSPFSSPKGSLFLDTSFGHTGYSGSSIWIDTKQDMFVVLLTNRLNYRDIKAFNQLRSDISTIAVAEFRKPVDNHQLIALSEVARINADILRPTVQTMPTLSHNNYLVAAASEPNSKSHRKSIKKSGKKHRYKPSNRNRHV